MADEVKDKPPIPPEPKARVKVSPEIEIEFGDNKNRVFAWGPTMEILRGRWTRACLNSDELVEEVALLPDIPGMRVRINYERRTGLVYDPLSLPEHKVVCDQIRTHIKKIWNRDEGPKSPVERTAMDADDLKSWLYLMRRMVDAKSAKVTAGELPMLDVIDKLPGRTRMEWFNNSARACKWREEYEDFTKALLSGMKFQVA